MQKIIIDPKDHRSIEVSINESIGPRLGSTSPAYAQLVKKENAVLHKLLNILQSKELPKIVALLSEIYPDFRAENISERITESMNVINKVSHLMLDGFHISVIASILDITCGHGGNFGGLFCSRFYPLCDKGTREDFWGTRWELPCFVVAGLLEDLMNDVDIDNPTAEDLKKSKVIEVAGIYQCPQEKIDDFIAAY